MTPRPANVKRIAISTKKGSTQAYVDPFKRAIIAESGCFGGGDRFDALFLPLVGMGLNLVPKKLWLSPRISRVIRQIFYIP